MKITPRTADAAAPTGSGTASTLSGSTCVMAFNSGTADRLITIQTGKFAVASLAISAATGISSLNIVWLGVFTGIL